MTMVAEHPHAVSGPCTGGIGIGYER